MVNTNGPTGKYYIQVVHSLEPYFWPSLWRNGKQEYGLKTQLHGQPVSLFHEEGWKNVNGKGVYTSIIIIRSSLISSPAAAAAGPSSALQAGLSVTFTVVIVLYVVEKSLILQQDFTVPWGAVGALEWVCWQFITVTGSRKVKKEQDVTLIYCHFIWTRHFAIAYVYDLGQLTASSWHLFYDKGGSSRANLSLLHKIWWGKVHKVINFGFRGALALPSWVSLNYRKENLPWNIWKKELQTMEGTQLDHLTYYRQTRCWHFWSNRKSLQI